MGPHDSHTRCQAKRQQMTTKRRSCAAMGSCFQGEAQRLDSLVRGAELTSVVHLNVPAYPINTIMAIASKNLMFHGTRQMMKITTKKINKRTPDMISSLPKRDKPDTLVNLIAHPVCEDLRGCLPASDVRIPQAPQKYHLEIKKRSLPSHTSWQGCSTDPRVRRLDHFAKGTSDLRHIRRARLSSSRVPENCKEKTKQGVRP